VMTPSTARPGCLCAPGPTRGLDQGASQARRVCSGETLEPIPID
jgi:hypothetical protein